MSIVSLSIVWQARELLVSVGFDCPMLYVKLSYGFSVESGGSLVLHGYYLVDTLIGYLRVAVRAWY